MSVVQALLLAWLDPRILERQVHGVACGRLGWCSVAKGALAASTLRRSDLTGRPFGFFWWYAD